jgi:hypothetical protein
MTFARRQFLQIAAAATLTPALPRIVSAQSTLRSDRADFVFPADQWEKATPAELGWSPQKIEEARRFFQTLPTASMIVVDRG